MYTPYQPGNDDPPDDNGGPQGQGIDPNRLGPRSLSINSNSTDTTFHSYISNAGPSAQFFPSSSSLHNALLPPAIHTIDIPPLITIPGAAVVSKIQDLPPIAKLCFYRAQGIFIGDTFEQFLYFRQTVDVEGCAALAWKKVIETRAMETDHQGQQVPGVEPGEYLDRTTF